MRCCSVNELKAKEVISEKNGCRLGYVNDVEIDLQDGRLVALIIYGRTKFGFAAHDCDWRICWAARRIWMASSRSAAVGMGAGR